MRLEVLSVFLIAIIATVVWKADGQTCCPSCTTSGLTQSPLGYTTTLIASMPYGGVVTSLGMSTTDGSSFKGYIDDGAGNSTLITGGSTTCFMTNTSLQITGSSYYLGFTCTNYVASCTFTYHTQYTVNPAPGAPFAAPTTPPAVPTAPTTSSTPSTATSTIAVRIYSDSNCQNLQSSFTIPNDPSICQSLGSGAYAKGSCVSGGQLVANLYTTPDCSDIPTAGNFVRENVCGSNVFSGSGQSAEYTCPGSQPPTPPAPTSDTHLMTLSIFAILIVFIGTFLAL